ncbi:hypothetical protein [Streptomyces sp. NBC_01803]|uniref:hypothetical protein n=1 Tax=Streptomyces sp. NBC_01803 TaxID=2975946 RepID=UPI002DD7EC14|nr:hypothetical protein [Streptomyces sp. NBC_01803]WSA45226.1 hypothetical protein OIE51_14005 [Streptomyces sp. NBC_01803]
MAASVLAVLLPSAALATPGHRPSPPPSPVAVAEPEPELDTARFAARPQGGEVLPVLPLGTGLACLGLGIGALGLRLRQP